MRTRFLSGKNRIIGESISTPMNFQKCDRERNVLDDAVEEQYMKM